MAKSEILRQVMVEVGITQSGLSELSGVKQPSLSQMLSGRIEMSDSMLDRLLSCMGYRLEIIRQPVRVDLDRSSERRWRLHRRLARDLTPDSWERWLPRVLQNLEQLRGSIQGEPHVGNLQRWAELVGSSDLGGLRRVMTGLDPDAIQMREVSPLAGLLSDSDRRGVLAGKATFCPSPRPMRRLRSSLT